jgi:peptidoglycan hydrolase-like protein with peptidoglycan-binding domain
VRATNCPGSAAYELLPDINLYRRVMKRGQRGEDIRRMQQRLVAKGFAAWKNPRGIFGLGTHKAVLKARTKFFGSAENSNVGAKTYARLIRR